MSVLFGGISLFFLSQREFEREKGLKRTTILRWLRIFGLEDKPKSRYE